MAKHINGFINNKNHLKVTTMVTRKHVNIPKNNINMPPMVLLLNALRTVLMYEYISIVQKPNRLDNTVIEYK